MVLLKLVPSLRLELLFGQRFNGVVGGDFEAVTDGAAIRNKVIALGITRLTESAVQDLPVGRAADKLEDDFQGLTVIWEGARMLSQTDSVFIVLGLIVRDRIVLG